MKGKYYILWIEGLSPKNGEKVSRLTNNGYDTTTKMTEALRVKYWDAQKVLHYLKRHGVSDWTLDNCLVLTSYAPAGTILNTKLYQL